MGCFASKEEAPAAKSQDAEINKEMKQRKVELQSEVKLLLLGAGESGKSTIFKQLRIIHCNGYSQDECAKFVEVIQMNTLQSMQVLVAACQKFDIAIEIPDNRSRAEKLLRLDEHEQAVLNAALGKDIAALWKDPGILKAHTKKSMFQLNDSAAYFFNMVDRIFSEDFVPSPQDVLHARVKTTGITEMCFSFGGLNFRIVDVGGQRSERKKWIHCFAGVTAILFVTSLSEYDQRCYEDNTTLRMKESLLLFDDMCNHRFFVDTPIILFLNKTDLFDSKISSGIDLKVCFPEYNGGLNTANAKKYIAEKFCELNRNPRKQIYTHFTCATDTDNIRYVFSAVKDIILQNSLRTAGLID